MKGYKTIYILPNLVTTLALLCGFSSVLKSLQGNLSEAAILIFYAMIFDSFDGRIARWTKTESAFGVQYDSLSDLISFGVAPAILIYQWALHYIATVSIFPARLGEMVAFLYVTCAALRLARFNIQADESDKSVFIGLPSPAAAAILASFVWLGVNQKWQISEFLGVPLLLTIASALAMVSELKYYSFKTFKLEGRIPFARAFLPAVLMALILLKPSLTLFLIFLAYGIHAPIWLLWRYLRRRR